MIRGFLCVALLLCPVDVEARGPQKVEAFMLTAISLMVAVDVILAVDNIKDNTYSEVIRKWSGQTLAIPWVAGVVAGHLFHPWNYDRGTETWKALTLAGLSVAVAVSSAAFQGRKPRWMQAAAFVGGAVSGGMLWRF